MPDGTNGRSARYPIPDDLPEPKSPQNKTIPNPIHPEILRLLLRHGYLQDWLKHIFDAVLPQPQGDLSPMMKGLIPLVTCTGYRMEKMWRGFLRGAKDFLDSMEIKPGCSPEETVPLTHEGLSDIFCEILRNLAAAPKRIYDAYQEDPDDTVGYTLATVAGLWLTKKIMEGPVEGGGGGQKSPGGGSGPGESPAAPPKPAQQVAKGSTADFEHWVTPQTKGIIANLDKNGLVEFKINTQGSGVRGTDLFNRMMQHFGENAKGVLGKWVSGTNLNTVNELTAQSVPLEQAITRTWTANRARDAGFGRATLIKAEGKAGAYTNVEVQFTK